MPDLESLRDLATQVRPPALGTLEQVARRRGRRAAVSTTVGGLLAVVLVAAGLFLVNDQDVRSTQPVITPTPSVPATGSPRPTPTPTHRIATRMTPKEVVLADNARLLVTGVSADDPDFRLSLWEAECTWCPELDEERGRPTFYGLALTTDGFATTTYLRSPFFVAGMWHVESPGPGLLLVIDAANGPEWLVRDDGTVTRLTRVFEERRPADPRHWHVCGDNHGMDYQLSWCALDPSANTNYVWQGAWRSSNFSSVSLAGPGSTDEPWGLNGRTAPADDLVAYWYVDGVRHTRDLGPGRTSGEVHNLPRGVMSFWSLDQRAGTLSVYSSSDRGASWQTATLRAPIHSRMLAVSRTPGGGLLALQDDAFFNDGSPHEGEGIRLWRADSLDHGSFGVVYASRSRTDARGNYAPPFTVAGDRIWSGGLWSDDDGRTWSSTTWR